MLLRRLATAVAAATLALSALGGPVHAAGVTHWVNDDDPNGFPYAAPAPGTSCTNPGYPTINLAVAASSAGDTIQVCPGNYTEVVPVTVPHTLYLKGARAGHSFPSRTFGGPTESTVTGRFIVNAANVRIDGFSIKNPTLDNGITVKTAGDNALIVNNIINNIGGTGVAGPTTGVYLENGPDRVRIVGNRISQVVSTASAQGILVGDSTANNPSLDILIALNLIEDMTSARGAYGVQVNNGSSAVATGYARVFILANRIRNLTGGWARGVGLEGDTPGSIVAGNAISDIIASTPPARIAVFFEDNPSASTVHVNFNNFDVTSSAYGIALHPITAPGTVDGQCNWWDSSDGPGPVGPGSGALVGPRVDYDPWLRAPAPRGHCKADDDDFDDDGDDNHHDNDDDNDGKHDADDNDDDNDGVTDDVDVDDDNDGLNDTVDDIEVLTDESLLTLSIPDAIEDLPLTLPVSIP